MKRSLFISGIASCMLFLAFLGAFAQAPFKVACVGNSITEGKGLSKTYPAVLQELLGEDYEST
jgi:acyl-CoA thioesterase-1